MAKGAYDPSKTVFPTNGPDASQNLVNRVKNDYLAWSRYTTAKRNKWQDYWKLWNNQRINRQYFGDNDSFEPMVYQLIETSVNNVYGNRPKMAFMPRNRYQDADPKRLNLYWDFTWDENNMDQQIVEFGRENEVIGNGVFFVDWQKDHMGIKHIPYEDCFFDPASPDPQKGRYAGYRRLVMLSTLKRERKYNPDTESWEPRYKNLDKVTTSWSRSGEVTDREYKDMTQGSTYTVNDDNDRQCEVMYICYLDRIVEIVNRSWTIYDEPNEYHKDEYTITAQDREDENNDKLYDEQSVPPDAADQVAGLPPDMAAQQLEPQLQPVNKKITIPEIEPFLPFAVQRSIIDHSMPVGRGLVEIISGLQEDFNDVLNMKKDNLAYAIKSVTLLDPVYQDQIDNLAMAKPGDIVPIAPAMAEWMKKDDMSVAADSEMARLKQSMHDASGISGILSGNIPAGVRTAVEINALINIASAGFKVKTKSLESQCYNRLGRMFVWMMQIFADDKIDIPALDTDSGPQVFDPEPYWGDWNIKVQLETDADVIKTQQGQQAMEMRQAFMGDPNVDQKEIDKFTLQRGFDLDEDEIGELMPPDAVANNTAGLPTGMPNGLTPGQTPGGMPGQPPQAVLPTKPTALPMMARPNGKPNA